MKTPLVSVICLCHNQKNFVEAAIRSVFAQTYQNIELIVVDDASTDGSKEEIKKILKDEPVQFIDIEKNIGNCAAFNQGYRASKGAYIIDLAADDLLLPKRIEEGVNDFSNAKNQAGIHFSDAFVINEKGDILSTHYPRNPEGKLKAEIPQGDIYINLIRKYFICPPTMMFKREVLNALNGYDESLLYEDFDFWIRSSRQFEYIFNGAPLVKRRIVKHSDSHVQFSIRTKHAFSTFKICQKIFELNQSKEEDKALIRRCRYEIKQCAKTINLSLIPKYLHLMRMAGRRIF
ncbi:MAG: glycosyltransferase [Marinoscillum sp.]